MGHYLSQAELVIEGKVLDKTFAVRNDQTGSIETVHTIQIDRVLKGNTSMTMVEVHTPGGRLDDIIESVSHGSTLSGGQKGIYLLSPNSISGYHLQGGNAGKITRLTYDDDYEAIHWGELDKYKNWRQLREQIGASLGVDLTIHPLTATELQAFSNNKEFCVKLDNPVPDVEEMTVEFDVMAKSSVPGLKFARAEVIIDYPTGNLGEYIVARELIEGEKGETLDDPAYTIEVEDQTKDQIELSIESPCDNNVPHYVLDTVYEKLATLTVEVEDWGDFGTMNVDSFAVAGTAEFVDPPTFQGTPGCTEFDDLCGEGEFLIKTCRVDGILFLQDGAAGKRNTVLFSGTDFGDGTDGRLLIPDADNAISNGNHDFFNVSTEVRSKTIIDWDSTFVEIEISSNPLKIAFGDNSKRRAYGSGKWRIRPNGGVLGCNADIDVPYAYYNSWYEFVDGQRANNFSPIKDTQNVSQPLRVYINENLRTQIGATSIYDSIQFEALIRKYVCRWADALNIDISVSTGIPFAPTQGYITLRGSFILDSLTHGKTTRSLSANGSCVQDLIGIEQPSADIAFNLDDSWYISEGQNIDGDEYDFLSILMHELGHSLGFTHAMDGIDNGTNDSKLMFHRLNSGDIKRIIDFPTVLGAGQFGELLRSSNAGCFSSKNIALKDNSCVTTSVQEPYSRLGDGKSRMAFNTFSSAIQNVRSTGRTVSGIYDINGLEFSQVDLDSADGLFPSGIYFLYSSDGEVIYVVITNL